MYSTQKEDLGGSPASMSSWIRVFILIICAALVASLVVVAGLGKSSQAAPFAECDTNGFLFKYPGGPTAVHSVDMVTGQDSLAGTVAGRQINAVGYNPVDTLFMVGMIKMTYLFVSIATTRRPIPSLSPAILDPPAVLSSAT